MLLIVLWELMMKGLRVRMERKRNWERKKNWASGWALFQAAVVGCREAGEGTGLGCAGISPKKVLVRSSDCGKSHWGFWKGNSTSICEEKHTCWEQALPRMDFMQTWWIQGEFTAFLVSPATVQTLLFSQGKTSLPKAGTGSCPALQACSCQAGK